MSLIVKYLAIFILSISFAGACSAQCSREQTSCPQDLPRFVKFSGELPKFAGANRGRVIAVRFSIYGNSSGGDALWQETQNVQLDPQGRYDAILGATRSDGLPMELFSNGESRWLTVQPLWPGESEEPRVMLVSVPYALQAANAQTLGGLPPSAYVKSTPQVVENSPSTTTTSSSTSSSAPSASAAAVATSAAPSAALQTINTIPKFTTGGVLSDSQISDVNGSVSVRNLSNILFANRFPGGVPDAVGACPANGCVIYALSPDVNRNLGNVDPGNKSITIYLGPFTYSVNTITLRKGMKIIGMGASQSPSGASVCTTASPCNGTALQSTNANAPVFVIPQTSDNPATDIRLTGFRVFGAPGNTSQDGFFLDSSATRNTGLWESIIEDVSVSGFAGIGIHIKSRNDNFSAASQWLIFNNVVVFRNRGGGNALRLEGAVFELRFVNCEFDGQALGDGTNIFIGGLAGGTGGFPTSIVFEGLVSQNASLAVHIDGGVNLAFHGSHHESLQAGYQITDRSSIGTRGVTISDGYFAGNVGLNGGAGYELNVAASNASGIVFSHNQIFGPPDAVVKSTNLASVVYQDNLYGPGRLPVTSALTTQMSPAAAIDIQGVHSIGLNPSPTAISTIHSGLGPGETVTFFTLGGPVTFQAGGNIDLMGQKTLTLAGTITLARVDLGGLKWIVVSQWSPTVPPATQP
jgi:hypothetical protein